MVPKDLFADLIKCTVAPYLKNDGFKKASLNFHKTHGDLYYVINFQCDTRNSYGQHRFYVNCGIHSYALDKILGQVRSKPPKYFECFFHARIEQITGSSNQWYDLNSGTDMEDVTICVMSDIQKLIKYLNTIDTTESLVEILLTGYGLMQYEETLRYLIKTGNMQRMADFAKKIYDVKPNVEGRWSFFENKVNTILSSEGFKYKLQDFVKT